MTSFTQRMTLHLNGGSDFSQLNYDVFADGKRTKVYRVTRTDGSPRYMKTTDKLSDGENEFDVLATRGAGMEDWLKQYAVPAEEANQLDMEGADDGHSDTH